MVLGHFSSGMFKPVICLECSSPQSAWQVSNLVSEAISHVLRNAQALNLLGRIFKHSIYLPGLKPGVIPLMQELGHAPIRSVCLWYLCHRHPEDFENVLDVHRVYIEKPLQKFHMFRQKPPRRAIRVFIQSRRSLKMLKLKIEERTRKDWRSDQDGKVTFGLIWMGAYLATVDWLFTAFPGPVGTGSAEAPLADVGRPGSQHALPTSASVQKPALRLKYRLNFALAVSGMTTLPVVPTTCQPPLFEEGEQGQSSAGLVDPAHTDVGGGLSSSQPSCADLMSAGSVEPARKTSTDVSNRPQAVPTGPQNAEIMGCKYGYTPVPSHTFEEENASVF
ncbi:hypothetical protein FB451DRAFT_1177950 [Mycena latifolia]|nr:hypothetical protein FB451DRAFT_1177950 [Mycena latifolia]